MQKVSREHVIVSLEHAKSFSCARESLLFFFSFFFFKVTFSLESSSPVDVELVDAVEVTGCRGTEK